MPQKPAPRTAEDLWWIVAENTEPLTTVARKSGLKTKAEYQRLWRWFNEDTKTLDYDMGIALWNYLQP